MFGVARLHLLFLEARIVARDASGVIDARTREFGIRLALGANPGDLRKMILGQALKLTGIGLVIALPISLAISQAMASLIFGVVSVDYTILAGFSALLLVVALAAGYLPARRAIGVVPMVSLRYE